jgi:hypothetical protein
MFAGPAVAPAQTERGKVFLVGYGVLTVAAVGRLILGNGEADVAPGSRVHIHLASGTFVGQVASISKDSLVIETPTGSRAFANTDLDDLGVSVGPRARWAQGYFYGLAIGSLCGAALGLSAGDRPDLLGNNVEEKAEIVGAIVGVDGSVVGAFVGAFIHREAWSHPRRPLGGGSLAVTPVLGRRTGLAVRMTF